MSVLICTCHRRGAIRFRQHDLGYDVVAVSSKRARTVRWFEVQRKLVKPDVYQERLFIIEPGEKLDYIIVTLINAGYADDDRDPIVREVLRSYIPEARKLGWLTWEPST